VSDTAVEPEVTSSGRRREVMVILPGLMLAMMLAMLDNMIVGTAMPRIVGELGGLDHLSWVVTAYVLGTTVSTPLWGKIGDLYGRKNIFITSIVIFLVGSALSGMSQSMGELIGFRALQGLGAGGLIVGVMAIIGDLVPPRERGRYQGIMAGIMALAMVAGPLAGGFITDNLNWRWAFYVNLPLGGAALVSAIGFVLGLAMFGAINFLPLYQQTVQGSSATNSGLLLLPMMLAMMVVSIIAGQVITKTGKYKMFPVIGGLGMTTGMILLSFVDVGTTKLQLALFMAALGLGMGFLMQTTMLIAQNSVEQKDLGVASSTATFFRSIGGSFGVALFGTIFVRHLKDDLTGRLGAAAAEKMTSGGGQVDPKLLQTLPAGIRDALFHGIASSLSTVFLWAIPFAALVAVLAFFIREIKLRGHEDTPAPAEKNLVAALD